MHRMCNIDSKHTTECLAEQATRAEQTKSANVSDHNLQMEKINNFMHSNVQKSCINCHLKKYFARTMGNKYSNFSKLVTRYMEIQCIR